MVGLAAVFGLDQPWFPIVAAIVFLGLGGWEAACLGGLKATWLRLAAALMLLAIGAATWLGEVPIGWILAASCAVWLAALCWLGMFDRGHGDGRPQPLKLIMLALILLGAWHALIWLQAISPWYLVLVVIVIVAADTGAYFVGKAVGGRKLAPRISPGKTRSGAIGGLICAMLITALVAASVPASPFPPLQMGLLAAGLALVSIGGDLLISLFKRHAGMKDTSNVLPGHGGILDRFDSLCAAAPFFGLVVWLVG